MIVDYQRRKCSPPDYFLLTLICDIPCLTLQRPGIRQICGSVQFINAGWQSSCPLFSVGSLLSLLRTLRCCFFATVFSTSAMDIQFECYVPEDGDVVSLSLLAISLLCATEERWTLLPAKNLYSLFSWLSEYVFPNIVLCSLLYGLSSLYTVP